MTMNSVLRVFLVLLTVLMPIGQAQVGWATPTRMNFEVPYDRPAALALAFTEMDELNKTCGAPGRKCERGWAKAHERSWLEALDAPAVKSNYVWGEQAAPQFAGPVMLLQTAGRNSFAGATTVTAVDTTTSSGTVTVRCNGSTCPAGVYRIDVFAQVINANTQQTSPNMRFDAGFTSATGGLTVQMNSDTANGATTISTATTGLIFSGSLIAKTTGALTIAMVLSGTTGAQKITWEYAATRLK